MQRLCGGFLAGNTGIDETVATLQTGSSRSVQPA